MTTIYSYNRLDEIFSALVDLRYRLSHDYITLHDQLTNHSPGFTVESMRRLPSPMAEMYERLLIEDAKLLIEGESTTFVAIDMDTFSNRFLDEDVLSLAEYADAIHIVGKLPEGVPAGNVFRQRFGGSRRIIVNEADLPAITTFFAPNVEWDFSRTRTSNTSGWAQDVFPNWRFLRDVLPENVERLGRYLTGYEWDSVGIGSVYSNVEGNRIVRYGIGLNEEGELEQAPYQGSIMVLNVSDMLWANELDNRLAEARNAYRTSVLSRLRTWRSNDEEDRQRRVAQQSARRASLERFISFRNKKGGDMDKTMWISTLPFVESGKGIKSSRRWGIEIETGAGRDLRGTPDQWDAKGDGSLESAYGPTYIEPEECEYAYRHESTVDATWTDANGNQHEGEIENPEYLDPYDCYDCGEIERDYYDDDDCVELVSPILNSMHSRGLREICEDLEHAPRTDSAGIHVHVEAKDLTVRQIKELVMGYDHIEHLLEASYDRLERGYCKRRSPDELLEIVRQSDNQTPTDMRKGDRYVTVNLQALYSHGTIEFRAMGPKYNYDHLVRWAMFCREMVNVVVAGATSKDFARVKTWDDVTAIFAKYGSEYNFATVGQMEEGVEFEDIDATV